MQSLNPVISVIMPVYNTGFYLVEAVNSVLHQCPSENCAPLPYYELLIIDDDSNCATTLELLEELAAKKDPRIVVLKNLRKKGAAGARNTGIDAARGSWITFLDSDDIWLPDSLALRWAATSAAEEVKWIAARFLILRPTKSAAGTIDFPPAEELTSRYVRTSTAPKITQMIRPVREFSRECFTGIMTVLIKKSLIVNRGMFDERLSRAEDYTLWFRCSFDQDLYFVEAETAYYRIHPNSLTHGEQPRLLYEDKMIELLLRAPDSLPHGDLLMQRLDIVMQEHCYFYRSRRQFGPALNAAANWVIKRPQRISAWKELLAAILRVT